jgi:hypothetical protein
MGYQLGCLIPDALVSMTTCGAWLRIPHIQNLKDPLRTSYNQIEYNYLQIRRSL